MRTVTRALRRASFADRIEGRRHVARSAYEPFCPAAAGPGPAADESGRLVTLLHDGVAVPGGLEPELVAELTRARLADGPRPGHWAVTAYRGVLAVRDRAPDPGAPEVYIGEDSLRFVETILGAAARGRALDVGAGSGITGCALARTADQVMSVDVADQALEATAVSAALNGVSGRVVPVAGRFEELEPRGRFNAVAANLPYVPVPAGLAYSPAGNGGPDGLALIRMLLERAPDLLDPADGTLIMRLQSLGDARGPLLLPELRAFAARTGHDVVITVDGRVPYEVRAALTAVLAARHNPHLDPGALLRSVTAHLRGYGLPHFLACGVVARAGGTGRVDVADVCPPPVLDRVLLPVRSLSAVLSANDRVAARYWRAGRALPDGFWELGDEAHLRAPIERFEELTRAMAAGATVRAATEQIFSDLLSADPARAQSLLVTAELLAVQLLGCGLVAPR